VGDKKGLEADTQADTEGMAAHTLYILTHRTNRPRFLSNSPGPPSSNGRVYCSFRMVWSLQLLGEKPLRMEFTVVR